MNWSQLEREARLALARNKAEIESSARGISPQKTYPRSTYSAVVYGKKKNPTRSKTGSST